MTIELGKQWRLPFFSDVPTMCIGQPSSNSAFLLTAGTKSKRHNFPNSMVMIHQVLGGYQGQGTDIQIHAKETQRVSDMISNILAKHTGQLFETIQKDTNRDNFMSAND